MTDLTAAQIKLLAAAAAHPDGLVERAPGAHMTEAALARRGLIEVQECEGDAPRLILTQAGRDAFAAAQGAAAKAPDEPRPGTPLAEPGGKVAVLLALLRRPQGATLADMQAATGWQAHSVRGALSGAIKAKLKLEVTSEKSDASRTYRVRARGAA